MIPTGRRGLILILLHVILAAAWAVGALGIAPNLSRFEAGLIALGLSLAFGLALWGWDDRFAAPRPPEGGARVRSVNVVLLVVGFAFLALTVLTGAVHDYTQYLQLWSVVLQGRDPWFLEGGYWGLQPPTPTARC